MGEFLETFKNEARDLFQNKKSLVSFLLLGILILAIPVGLDLIDKQRIFKSKAAGDPVIFVASDDVFQKDGKWFIKKSQVSLQLTSPLGPPPSSPTSSPSTSPSPSPTQSSADTTAPTTTITLNPASGFTTGQTVTMTFTGVDTGGSGLQAIHTAIWPGLSTQAEVNAAKNQGNSGSYQGFNTSSGSKTATVPFYIEYLGEDKAANKETTHTLFVKPQADTTAPTTSVTLNPASGFTSGQSVTVTFNATDQGGSSVKSIHTTVWSGASNQAELDAQKAQGNKGVYQGFNASSGSRTVTVPSAMEYLSEDSAKNLETTHTLFVKPVTLTAPTGLSQTCSAGGTSVTFKWNTADGALTYALRNNKHPFDVWPGTGDIEKKWLTTTSQTLSISPNTSYQWKVSSQANSKEVDSAIIEFSCPG